jgi:uncharacterized membrane protein HdeD (DUF308 family)
MRMIYSPASTLSRSLIAIAIGVVLIIWPEKVQELLVTVVGVLLMIPSVITLTPLLFSRNNENKKQQMLPVLVGTGLAILGLIMILIPETFISLFTLLIGILLFLAGLMQVIGVFNYCRQARNFWLMLTPLIILIMGVVTISNFKNISNILLIMIGVTSLLYGISEILNYYKLRCLK